MGDKTNPNRTGAKALSLAPLTPEEALRIAMNTPMPGRKPKGKARKKPAKKG
ncbi:MAG: hypothetical protein HY290_27700 [Planctomycetia bacterium]|nr:hypothetical protein [Planctomycetia bacterium]